MNNKQEVFDIPTLGYTDWRKTVENVIEFGIKNWNGHQVKKPMICNFPVYVKTKNQRITFVAQFNNRLMLAGLQVNAKLINRRNNETTMYSILLRLSWR